MAEAFYLTPEDQALLRQMLGEWKARNKKHGPREHIQLDDGFAPEVYFAYIPAGIPVRDGNIVNWAIGTVYRVLPSGILEITPIDKKVYNPSPDFPIAADSWVPVWRDKFGTWLAQAPGSGGTGTGTTSDSNEWIPARVIGAGQSEYDGYTLKKLGFSRRTRQFFELEGEGTTIQGYRLNSADVDPPLIKIGQDVLVRQSPVGTGTGTFAESTDGYWEVTAWGGQHSLVDEVLIHVEPVCINNTTYLDLYFERKRKQAREQCWTVPVVGDEPTALGPGCAEE